MTLKRTTFFLTVDRGGTACLSKGSWITTKKTGRKLWYRSIAMEFIDDLSKWWCSLATCTNIYIYTLIGLTKSLQASFKKWHSDGWNIETSPAFARRGSRIAFTAFTAFTICNTLNQKFRLWRITHSQSVYVFQRPAMDNGWYPLVN